MTNTENRLPDSDQSEMPADTKKRASGGEKKSGETKEKKKAPAEAKPAKEKKTVRSTKSSKTAETSKTEKAARGRRAVKSEGEAEKASNEKKKKNMAAKKTAAAKETKGEASASPEAAAREEQADGKQTKRTGRRSGGGNRGAARRSGSSKPAKKQAELKKAELLRAGYEEIEETETFFDYEKEGAALTGLPKLKEFMKKRQAEINELAEPYLKNKRTRQEETLARVADYRNVMSEAYEHAENADRPKTVKSRAGSKKKKAAQTAELIKPGIGKGRIKVIFLGGLEQIGMNITAFESDDSIIVVDCGMAFPDESMPGIDLVIPDVTYLEEHQDKLRGFFITHGHEDHIGALPYVLKKLNIPVYCTRLTRALIEIKLKEAGLLDSAKLNTVQFGDVIPAGDFAVEFIKTNHSIQDAAALALHTPAGTILHTGDFKVDYTPVFGDTIDLQRFAELGKQGVLALMCDSTNATRAGFTMSERTVGRTFENIFAEYQNKRIIVATFASNVDRVQQIITVAEKYDRKVVIDGRSMVNVIGAANELGYITVKDGTLIDISEMKNYSDEKIALVVTGSQGEPMAALSRMAQGLHKKVYLSDNDVIVLSSTPIPGNEKAVSKIINDLSRRHTKVIYQETHVSGHACAEDIKLIYSLVHPRYAIPVHGEYRHRLAQRELALAVGVTKENIIMADNGDVIDLCADYCVISDRVQAGPVLVDGLGVGDVGNIVLRDRQSLAQNGIIIATIALERSTGQIMAGPDIVTRGFVYVRENEDLIEEARNVVLDALDDCALSGNDDWAHIKNVIKDELNEFIWKRMKRTPMILPIISEV